MKFHAHMAVVLFTTSLVGCASNPELAPSADTVSLFGKLVDRSEVAAQPKWSVNEDYTRAMGGIVGVLLAQSNGTSKHFRYIVEDSQRKNLEVRARTEIPLNSCVEIVVPKTASARDTWMLGEASIRGSQRCE